MSHLGGGLQGQPKRSGYIGGDRQGGVVWMNFVPAILDRDGICAAQQIGAAGNLLLNGALVSGSRANVNPAKGAIGSPGYGRCVGVYSAGNLAAITFRVYGFDCEGERLVEDITGPNNTTGAGKKAFAVVDRVAANAAVATNVEVGTIDVFGLPAYLSDQSEIVRLGWNNATPDNAGTVVAGVITNPATATTGDIRGTLTTTVPAANGVIRLVCVMLQPPPALWYGAVRQFGAGVP